MLPGLEAEERREDLGQFYTPPELADFAWSWAKAGGSHASVLEPSAGDGALLKAVMRSPGFCWRATAVEIDPRRIEALSALRDAGNHVRLNVASADFLTFPTFGERWELGFSNPPYEGREIFATEHLERAAQVCDRVVAILQNQLLHGQARAKFWRLHDITRGVWLTRRWSFGQTEKSRYGERDFCLVELRKRQRPREAGESMACSWEWW